MSHLGPLVAELGVVLLVSVMLSLVCPRRWSLGLSLVPVAFVEAAFVQFVSPLESAVLVASCLWSSALVSRALAVSTELLSTGLMLRYWSSWRHLVGSGQWGWVGCGGLSGSQLGQCLLCTVATTVHCNRLTVRTRTYAVTA